MSMGMRLVIWDIVTMYDVALRGLNPTYACSYVVHTRVHFLDSNTASLFTKAGCQLIKVY
jgi:hypothetical protein